MSKNYPGELGKRRKPAREWDDREGLNLALGRKLTDQERDAEVFVELIANRDYYDKGIRLIAEHYRVAAPVPKSVIIDFVLPPDGAFWRELALKLLMDKVPLFQPPARRGPRSTLRPILPLIRPIIEGGCIEDDNETAKALLKALRLDRDALPPTEGERRDKIAAALRITRESLDRELARSKAKAGENSAE